MNWALGNSLFPQSKMAGPFHLLVPFPAATESKKKAPSAEPLPDDLPDYLVYVTRNALLAGTTSLTKASTEAYDFFTKLCQFLAFERFMRSVAAWWMPGMTPFYMNGVQPWMIAAPQQQPTLLPFWGFGAPLAPAKVQNPFAVNIQQPPRAAASPASDFAAMMAIPAAFLAFTPAFLDAWRVAL